MTPLTPASPHPDSRLDILEALPDAIVILDASAVLVALAPSNTPPREFAAPNPAITPETQHQSVAALRVVAGNAAARAMIAATSFEDFAARLQCQPAPEPFGTILEMLGKAIVRRETRGTFSVHQPAPPGPPRECLVQHAVPDDGNGSPDWSRVTVAVTDLGRSARVLVPPETERDLPAEILARANVLVWRAHVRRVDGEFRWKFEVPASAATNRLFHLVTSPETGLLWSPERAPDISAMNERSNQAMLAGAPGYQQEFRVQVDGATVWLAEDVAIQRLAENEWSLVGVASDVTARREAEAAHERSAIQLRNLLERADCMLWQARVTEVGDTYHWALNVMRSGLQRRMFGDRGTFTYDNITGAGGHTLFGAHEVPEAAAKDACGVAALHRGAPGYQQEFRVITPEQTYWLQEEVTITTVEPGVFDLVGVIFDVTRRHEAEHASRRTQAQLQQMLERADCMLWLAHVIAAPGGYEWSFDVPASGLRRRLWGPEAPGDDVYGRRETDLYGPGEIKDRDAMNASASRALRAGAPSYENEFQVTTPTGVVWLHEHVSVTPAETDHWRLVGVVIDVTARRVAEAARLATEHRLQQILTRVDCLIWEGFVRERDNGHLSWSVYVPTSHLYRQLFGRDPLPGDTPFWTDLEIPQIEQMHARSSHALRHGLSSYAQEFSVIAPHRTFWLNEQVAIRPAGPKQWQLTGVVTDISARRTAETALATETERLSVTLRAMSEAVVTIDMYGRVQFLNRAAAELAGCVTAEAVGRELTHLCRFCDTRTGAVYHLPLETVLGDGGMIDIPPHTALVQRDGRNCLVAGRCVPVRDAASRIIGAVLVLDDITERQRLDEHLQRASKLESVGILAGGIAHDFNNILTAVMGNLSLGLLDIPATSPARQILADAHSATLRARDLTQQLLTFAKGGDPVRTVVHLPDLITEVARFALRGSSVGCEFELPADLWSADADRGQFGQIVQNLVINAAQAMGGGGQMRIAAANAEVTGGSPLPLAPGNYVRVTVTDHGRGIAPDDLTRIFDPYFTTKQHGHGLGLATVYSIVRRHGGHIDVESEPGRGTTFTIWLPASRESVARPPMLDQSVPKTLHGRVLFMDDEEPIRKLGGTMLRRLGLGVEVVADGAEAVRRYQEARDAGRPFDVVVMDLTVPGGMGGREAIAQLRQLDPAVRAIVSSGYSSDPVLANHRAYGFCGVVAKPYQVDQFTAALRAALAGAPA